MGKKLAIKGHSTRGKEVIELLEMLGGKNIHNLYGNNSFEYYVSGHAILNDRLSIIEDDDFVIFNLEEFLEKYPFKIGDKVIDSYGDTLTIKSMSWSADFETMVYDFEDSAIVLAAEDIKIADNKLSGTVYNSSIEASQFMQLGKITEVCFNTTNYENEVELKLGDYEIVVRGGETYAVRKKPAYPDNYEECVRIAKNIHGYDINIDAPAYRELLESFVKLLICRDAYWKIAGEKLELGKPWEPNEASVNAQYGIRPLLFPSKEIYNIFYDNFKDLIETCKELL